VEETAKIRTAHGDRLGAIAALWEALGAARSQLMRGELELAPTAFTIFGRKLATALTEDGRLDEAKGILEEVLDVAAPMDANRAHVLEQLAAIAELRGQIEEAVRRRHDAIEAAERSGNLDMAEAIRSLFGGSGSGAGLSRPLR
jgi:tetratricopeptide (TPR) repeat protein